MYLHFVHCEIFDVKYCSINKRAITILSALDLCNGYALEGESFSAQVLIENFEIVPTTFNLHKET